MDRQLEMFPEVMEAPQERQDAPAEDSRMVIFSFCLPRPEAVKLERRAGTNISEYVRRRLTYDLNRNHHGRGR